jgi:uncharacterized membrane protein YozB (DUF420 family)
MKSFIDKTIKPFLVIAGLGTCVAGLLVFLPRFALENIFKLPFVEDYTIFCQHWGLMVLLVGIFMIISAFRVSWRRPVLIYSAIEKTFMIFLYLSNIGHSFSAGFQGGAIMDAIIVIYLGLMPEKRFFYLPLFFAGNTLSFLNR